jgi:hypothetical protein
MAVQERFTPGEWQEVVAGPVDAGLLIAFAEPQGPLGLTHEVRAIYDATVTGVSSSPSELIREVGAVLARQKDAGGESDQLKAAAQQAKAHWQGDPQGFFLERLTRAVALVGQKAPADAAAYEQWLVACAEKTAQAAKEGGFFGFGGVPVTPRETAAIDRLRAALDAPVPAPAPPAPAETRPGTGVELSQTGGGTRTSVSSQRGAGVLSQPQPVDTAERRRPAKRRMGWRDWAVIAVYVGLALVLVVWQIARTKGWGSAWRAWQSWWGEAGA